MGARIEEHPILGKQEKGRLVTFYFDGKELTGYEGEPIAAALKAQGVMIHSCLLYTSDAADEL